MKPASLTAIVLIAAGLFTACTKNTTNPSPTTTTSTTTTVASTTTTTTTTTVPTSFTLSGLIVDESTNRPLSGAEVEILNGPNAGTTVRTDSSGLYSAPNLAAGTFTIRIRASGYDTADRQVTITNASVRVDVALRPTPVTTTTTTTVPTLNANFTVTPVPCTITGPSATVDCTVDGTSSTGPITSYVWTYKGVTVTNNVRFVLQLTCANTGASKDDTVPVTLVVSDATGASSGITKNVVVTKVNACGF